jgi:hypothetical protein
MRTGPTTAGNNLEDHPTVEKIRWRDVLRFSIRICLERVEPFEGHPDIFLPGTLHHSGYKPAPPSDHTPLARRSAFAPDATTHPGIAFPPIPQQPPDDVMQQPASRSECAAFSGAGYPGPATCTVEQMELFGSTRIDAGGMREIPP